MRQDGEKKNIVKRLREYFERRDEVVMAFLFGSQAKGITHSASDWDIAAYFKPKEYLELETEEEYPGDSKIWSDLVDVLQTNDVDFVVLNRAAPSLVYSVLSAGIPLIIRDRKMYLDILCKTSYEAMDWWQFVFDFWKIRERSASLSPEDKKDLIKYITFLEEEIKDREEIRKITRDDYFDDRFKRRVIERWIENLVMSVLDIAKIIFASDKKTLPQSYKDTLRLFAGLYMKIDESQAEKFAEFAELRNIVVHEYLDLRWKKIKTFIEESETFYPQFIEKVKTFIV